MAGDTGQFHDATGAIQADGAQTVNISGAATNTGTILAQGGRFGGWSLYVKDGVPAYDYNFLGLQQTRIAASQPHWASTSEEPYLGVVRGHDRHAISPPPHG